MKQVQFTALLLVLGMCSQYWAKPIVDPALRMQLLNKDDASIRVIAKFRDRDRGKMASQTGIQSQKIATSLVSQRQFIREMGLMKKREDPTNHVAMDQ